LSSSSSEKGGCSEKSNSPATTEAETIYGEGIVVRGSNRKAVKVLTGKNINNEDVDAFKAVINKGGYVGDTIAAINRLVRNGYDVRSCDQAYEWTILHYAIAGNAPLEIIRCLVEAGADPLAEDWQGLGRPVDLVRQYDGLPKGVKEYLASFSGKCRGVIYKDEPVSRLINYLGGSSN